MEGFLKLGFFSMADKVTDALGGSFPYILTGAVIVSIWIYFLLLAPTNGKHYGGFKEFFQDILNFRVMLGSILAKILYIAFAIVLFIIGVIAMIVVNFLVGLLGTIILQIVLRVMFEIFMVFFSIQENVVVLRESQEAIEEQSFYSEEEDEE
jgi:hypothetical protein